MTTHNALSQLSALLDFIENAPENENIISMDCNDHCEQMACLAERVAAGVSLDEVMPALQQYMRYWGDCREEFRALVVVLKAELEDNLQEG